MPRVSVILPTRDRPQLLARAVASVLAQTLEDFELIVVDNNRREAPVRGTAFHDARIRLVRLDDCRNAAMARNAGVALARGKWLTYLDDDDVYRPQKLERQLALADATQADLVLCAASFNLAGRRRDVQTVTRWQGDELLLRARWNTPLLFHRHPGAKRFDEELSPGEDAEFAHRLLADAGMVAVPVWGEPLVDIFPQPGERVNSNPAPVRRAAARILSLRPRLFSRNARRRFLLQALMVPPKLGRRPGRVAQLGFRLLRESRGADWRFVANALAVSLDWRAGRWVS